MSRVCVCVRARVCARPHVRAHTHALSGGLERLPVPSAIFGICRECQCVICNIPHCMLLVACCTLHVGWSDVVLSADSVPARAGATSCGPGQGDARAQAEGPHVRTWMGAQLHTK